MNKEVFDGFKKLSDTEKSEFKHLFKDSPVALKLISFIENSKNRNFKNSEAVSFVYANENEKYNVLENRYFKLRKKFLDTLTSLTKKESEASILTQEEYQFFYLKNNSQLNKESVYNQLIALEKECWAKNIFELLPAILDYLIFLNQTLNRNEKNKELFVKLELANKLLFDTNQLIFFARRIYEINYTKGIKHASKEFTLLKKLATKNKKYPRFLLCYHHISLYYKLGSSDYLNEMKVVSRHLATFKKLYSQNPLMPLVSYKMNYVKYQHFHFNMSTMFFYFNNCEFEEAYLAMKEVWKIVHANDSIFKIYRTESFYSNMVVAQNMTGKYAEGNETVDHYIQFLKENNELTKLPLAYTQKAELYVNSYPANGFIKLDQSFLLKNLEEYLKFVKKADNSQLSYEQVLFLKMRLSIVRKEYEQAMSILQQDALKKHINVSNIYNLYKMLLSFFIQKNGSISDIHKKAVQQKYKATQPMQFMQLNWLINFTQKIINGVIKL